MNTPRTKDAFDALTRRACGTEYVKAKMEEMEREFADAAQHMALARDEAGCPDDETLVIHCRELRADLDAERTARKAGQRVLKKVQSWMLEPDRSRAQSFTSVEVTNALALAAKLSA